MWLLCQKCDNKDVDTCGVSVLVFSLCLLQAQYTLPAVPVLHDVISVPLFCLHSCCRGHVAISSNGTIV
jgi:hypothetical protein